jgi:hypothetical protein
MNKLFLSNGSDGIEWKIVVPFALLSIIFFVLLYFKFIPVEFIIKHKYILLIAELGLVIPIFSINIIFVKIIPNVFLKIPSIVHIIISIIFLIVVFIFKIYLMDYLYYGIYIFNILLIGYDKQFNNPSIFENIIVSLLRLIYFAFFLVKIILKVIEYIKFLVQ